MILSLLNKCNSIFELLYCIILILWIQKRSEHLLATHMYIIDIEVTLSTPQSDVTSKSALKVDLGGPVCWEVTIGLIPF